MEELLQERRSTEVWRDTGIVEVGPSDGSSCVSKLQNGV